MNTHNHYGTFARLLSTVALTSTLIVGMSLTPAFSNDPAASKTFQAGVAAVDITPLKLPVISSGGFLARSGSVIHDRLFARGLTRDYLFYLDGPQRDDLRCGGAKSRAIQFVGGRMKATLEELDDDYRVELFFWNGLPNDNRPVTGYLFSYGPDGVDHCCGDHLGICGNGKGARQQGRLMFFNGDEKEEVLTGGPVIEPKTWNHVRLVRQGDRVRVYLNFEPQPVISGRATMTRP